MGDKIRIYDTRGVLQEFDPIDAAGTKAFTGAQSMGSQKLTSVAAPTEDGDALSKGDAIIAGGEVAVVANANVIGGIPVLFRVDTAGASKTITTTHKIQVLDAWCIAEGAGGAGDTITIDDGTDGISDAMDINILDKAIARAGTIDDAKSTLAAGGTLGITVASAADAEVFVLAVRVA